MRLNKYDLHRAFRFLPKELKEEMKSGTVFVGGGYLTSIVKGDEPNDIDVFVPSVEAAEALTKTLRNAFNLRDANKITVWKSDNATTIRRPHGVPIQIIHRWTFDKIEDVAKSFDFTCCCAAIGFEGISKQVVSYCDDQFYQDVAASRLVYRHPVRNEDAGGSMLRLFKYIRKGYNAPLSTIGGVMSRMNRGVDWSQIKDGDEEKLTKVLTALLVEVDPNSDPEKVLEDRQELRKHGVRTGRTSSDKPNHSNPPSDDSRPDKNDPWTEPNWEDVDEGNA